MEELWSSASYEPHLLSLPFAFAPAAFAIVIAYAVAMRGARTLRLWMLFHCVALLPYSIVVALSASTKSPDTAAQLYRFGASFIPLAAAAGTGFQLALIRKYRRYRVLVWLGMVTAGGWVIVGSLTDAAISGVHRLPVGLWSPNAGPWAPIALVHTVLLSIGGFIALTRAALDSKPSEERRQLRLALVANLVTYAGLVDVLMAYGIGTFPVGWLLSGIGSLLLLRAILVEDLLRVRAVDTSVPRLVAHFAVAVPLVWVALARVGTSSTWWGTTATILQCFLGVRVAIAIIGLFNRGARESYGGPLDRLLAQFVTRTRALSAGVEIASLATEIVDLGLGAKSTVLLASEADWGFTLPDGTRLADDDTPDPLLGSWLVEHHRTVFANDPEQEVPADLAPMLDAFLERQRARAIVPVRSGDELVALIVVPRPGARLRGPGLAFVERLADRLAEALIHARMAVRAAERAAIARDVGLARAVQTALLPARGPQQHGELAIIGSWRPATSCAGDFWGIYPLDDKRVLVAIGDVTGHGVASAMVTAAAVGACDAAARRAGGGLDLRELAAALDAAVRRVGGGELAMTCFASVIDHATGAMTYISCGHTTPYLCHVGPAALEMSALVGRGNLLGAGVFALPKVVERQLSPGDLVVWYTDGVIDAQDPAGKAFGDRRLQQLLRKLDPKKLAPGPVHDLIQGTINAHRAGRPLADDETVVVGSFGRFGGAA